jgi:hypothetical protein
MTMEERIKHLTDTLIACDDTELLHEMNALLDIFDDGNYRENNPRRVEVGGKLPRSAKGGRPWRAGNRQSVFG